MATAEASLMVQRVATALAKADGTLIPTQFHLIAARIAMGALDPPTNEMTACGGYIVGKENAGHVWQAMLHTALNERSEPSATDA